MNSECPEIIETLPFWRKRRWLVIFLAFFGFINIYTLRVNLSVAIVKMTENRTIILENGTQIFEQDFDWDSKEKGVILSSFFYGYILTQILGGYFASRIGGNFVSTLLFLILCFSNIKILLLLLKVFGIGILMTSIFTLITPFAANMSLTTLIIVRVIMGIFEVISNSQIHKFHLTLNQIIVNTYFKYKILKITFHNKLKLELKCHLKLIVNNITKD